LVLVVGLAGSDDDGGEEEAAAAVGVPRAIDL
jgi:hypothetical protein